MRERLIADWLTGEKGEERARAAGAAIGQGERAGRGGAGLNARARYVMYTRRFDQWGVGGVHTHVLLSAHANNMAD
ncbi:unnamed protein product [Lampetra fluviatilis]